MSCPVWCPDQIHLETLRIHAKFVGRIEAGTAYHWITIGVAQVEELHPSPMVSIHYYAGEQKSSTVLWMTLPDAIGWAGIQEDLGQDHLARLLRCAVDVVRSSTADSTAEPTS